MLSWVSYIQVVVWKILTSLSILERDSALSYSVVVIFIILTGGLLIGAATKDRLGKQLAHTSLHAWYDVRPFTRLTEGPDYLHS